MTHTAYNQTGKKTPIPRSWSTLLMIRDRQGTEREGGLIPRQSDRVIGITFMNRNCWSGFRVKEKFLSCPWQWKMYRSIWTKVPRLLGKRWTQWEHSDQQAAYARLSMQRFHGCCYEMCPQGGSSAALPLPAPTLLRGQRSLNETCLSEIQFGIPCVRRKPKGFWSLTSSPWRFSPVCCK